MTPNSLIFRYWRVIWGFCSGPEMPIAPATLMSTVSKFSFAGYSLSPTLYQASEVFSIHIPPRTAHLEVKVMLPAYPEGRNPFMDLVMLAQVGPSVFRLIQESTSRLPFKATPPEIVASGTCLTGLSLRTKLHSTFFNQDCKLIISCYSFPTGLAADEHNPVFHGCSAHSSDNNQMSPKTSLSCHECLGS